MCWMKGPTGDFVTEDGVENTNNGADGVDGVLTGAADVGGGLLGGGAAAVAGGPLGLGGLAPVMMLSLLPDTELL